VIINTKKGGAAPNIEALSVTANGTYTAPSGVDGYSPVTVDVPQQGFDVLAYATNVENLFANLNSGSIHLPNNLTLRFGPNISSLNGFMKYSGHSSSGGTKLTLYADGTITSLGSAFGPMHARAYETIEIGFDTSHITNWSGAFENNYGTKTILGELDCSAATNMSNAFSCYAGYDAGGDALRNITFKQNTIPVSTSFKGQKVLTNASLISIANGLNESVTGKSIELQAIPKATIQTLMGTVALDETSTYHVFTADESGTVTLQDFITSTKGWTIA